MIMKMRMRMRMITQKMMTKVSITLFHHSFKRVFNKIRRFKNLQRVTRLNLKQIRPRKILKEQVKN
jgi:hypothetical protein